MAQVLKEEVREKIIDSAKKEFLAYGYKSASMRHIAEMSQMTVGNLYRYFDSKEKLHHFIVEGCLKELNAMLLKITANNVSFQITNFTLILSDDQLRQALCDISDQLVEICFRHPQEFQILMLQSDLNDRIVGWFKDLIKYFIMRRYSLDNKSGKVDIIAGCYASAVIAGVKQCLSSCTDKDTCKQLSKAFMLSYALMLDNDLNDYL